MKLFKTVDLSVSLTHLQLWLFPEWELRMHYLWERDQKSSS